jgi:excisionase family DNA binding protein
MALYMKPLEVAELLSISRSKVYLLLAEGRIPGAFRIGQSWRVHRRILEAAVEQEALRVDRPLSRR